jgi:CheY-like chemotaxis protein
MFSSRLNAEPGTSANPVCTGNAASDGLLLQASQLATALARPKILLVADDLAQLRVTRKLIETRDCTVVSSVGVKGALKQIASQKFDVLITDLQRQKCESCIALVAAMRDQQPEALTLVVSDLPSLPKAPPPAAKHSRMQLKESVASILDRDVAITIQRWLSRAEQVTALHALPMDANERAAYLPEIMRNISMHLRAMESLEPIGPSAAAVAHGQLRYRQGYTAPLIVQESRILQMCIFETIQRNLTTVDFAAVLPDIMIIADEVDSQLSQSIDSFLSLQKEETSASVGL